LILGEPKEDTLEERRKVVAAVHFNPFPNTSFGINPAYMAATPLRERLVKMILSPKPTLRQDLITEMVRFYSELKRD